MRNGVRHLHRKRDKVIRSVREFCFRKASGRRAKMSGRDDRAEVERLSRCHEMPAPEQSYFETRKSNSCPLRWTKPSGFGVFESDEHRVLGCFSVMLVVDRKLVSRSLLPKLESGLSGSDRIQTNQPTKRVPDLWKISQGRNIWVSTKLSASG